MLPLGGEEDLSQFLRFHEIMQLYFPSYKTGGREVFDTQTYHPYSRKEFCVGQFKHIGGTRFTAFLLTLMLMGGRTDFVEPILA